MTDATLKPLYADMRGTLFLDLFLLGHSLDDLLLLGLEVFLTELAWFFGPQPCQPGTSC